MAVEGTVLNHFERVVKRQADWNGCVEFVRDELKVPMTDVGFYGLVAVAHQFGKDAAREKLAERKPVGAAASPSFAAPSTPSAKPPEIPAKKAAPPASNKPVKKPDIKKVASTPKQPTAKAKPKDKKADKKSAKKGGK